MEERESQGAWAGWAVLVHSARTAIAVVVSLLVARSFKLPEAHWAPFTTLVVTQSSLGAALKVSRQRFFGTAMGAAFGAIVTSWFQPTVVVFGFSVFLLGLICAVVRANWSAYRFAGITIGIVLLIPRAAAPAWMIGAHRFAEVSIGIGVALVLAMVWPEAEEGVGTGINKSG